MIKNVVKMVDKIRVPIIVMNLLVIGATFYKQGKLDAISELSKIDTESNN